MVVIIRSFIVMLSMLYLEALSDYQGENKELRETGRCQDKERF